MAKVEDKNKQNDSNTLTTETKDQTSTPVVPSAASQAPQTEATQSSEVKDPLAKLGSEEADQVKLVEGLLNEFTTSISKKSDLGEAARGTYGKLHGAFRTMMGLRGASHKEAARVFMRAFKKHSKGSLDYDMRCRHLDLLPRDQRSVFTGYLDLLSRFEKASDKGSFRQNNNIDRLINRIADKELAAAINGVFPG